MHEKIVNFKDNLELGGFLIKINKIIPIQKNSKNPQPVKIA